MNNIAINELYQKQCPKCGGLQSFKNKKSLDESLKYNHPCKSCSHIGKNTWMKGQKLSDETKNKMSIAMKGKNTWNKTRGVSYETKIKLSQSAKGKIRSAEYRKNIRISKLKRLEKLGIPQCMDKGAIEFFNKVNELGYNFQPKIFMEIGYAADGYDKNKHIWYEYDTPYHKNITQQKKDLIRQNNIVKYFESIGKPLYSFVRTQLNKDGNVLETKCVYGQKIII
jgi:endogenous inhibitor of DNA gyrase (YacG/DUF329 family)